MTPVLEAALVEIILAVMALFFVATVTLAAVAAVKTKRAVQRGIERHAHQARRMVEDTTLRARRLTQTGTAAQLAELRLSVRTSLESTRRILQDSAVQDSSLSEALALCSRLDEHARSLDGELKQLERETDRGRVEQRLPLLRERAQRLTHSADSLRWAAQDRARQFADEELAELGQKCEMEAGALRHWTPPPVTSGTSEQRAQVAGAEQKPRKAFPGSSEPRPSAT